MGRHGGGASPARTARRGMPAAYAARWVAKNGCRGLAAAVLVAAVACAACV
ncbi:MAG: hypothetical protein ACLUE1_03735 [Adlercreutzia equolifaciens]